MDEVSRINNHWEIEEIPNDDFVLRHVHSDDRTGSKGRRYPNEAHFILEDGERGLSVNWDKYMDVRNNYILIGSTYNKNNRFIDYTFFKIFKFKVKNIRSIVGIRDVVHDPVFFGEHPKIGSPNNQAHSLILYEDDINNGDVRMNLSDYCRNNFDTSYCNFDVSKLKEEINLLQKRLDAQES
jgi:hypothetical protein